jgi:hypothetical protein
MCFGTQLQLQCSRIMIRRFRIYFTGFGIGLIMVYVIFSKNKERKYNIWTPEQRILEDIRNDEAFQSSERLACFVACLNLSEKDLEILWTEASTESLNPGGNPYIYLIELERESTVLQAEIELTKDEIRTLKYLKYAQKDAPCTCDD